MKYSILVATPAFGCQAYTSYIISILALERLCKQLGIEIDFIFRHDSLITRARNTLANIFIKSQFTHLLFLDADIQVSPYDIIKMLEADKMIIGGKYPKKEINWDQMATASSPLQVSTLKSLSKNYAIVPDKMEIKNNIDEVDYIGTGIMLINKQVFLKLIEKYPDNEKYYSFFECGIVNNHDYLSEDYWFCDKIKKNNEKVYVLHDCNSNHWGCYVF